MDVLADHHLSGLTGVGGRGMRPQLVIPALQRCATRRIACLRHFEPLAGLGPRARHTIEVTQPITSEVT